MDLKLNNPDFEFTNGPPITVEYLQTRLSQPAPITLSFQEQNTLLDILHDRYPKGQTKSHSSALYFIISIILLVIGGAFLMTQQQRFLIASVNGKPNAIYLLQNQENTENARMQIYEELQEIFLSTNVEVSENYFSIKINSKKGILHYRLNNDETSGPTVY